MKNSSKKTKQPVEKTEQEIVRAYVNRTIKNQIYHGRVDTEKFKGMEYKSVSKNLWLDHDFYFSVVFQSAEQKYAFLDHLKKTFGVDVDEKQQVQIVNGLVLAQAFGVKLKEESVREYPTADIDLLPFVLDNEAL